MLPRTSYDKTIDAESPRPVEQSFEKLSVGLYLGEIFRLVLLDLHKKGLIFKDQDVSKMEESYAVDTAVLSDIEIPRGVEHHAERTRIGPRQTSCRSHRSPGGSSNGMRSCCDLHEEEN